MLTLEPHGTRVQMIPPVGFGAELDSRGKAKMQSSTTAAQTRVHRRRRADPASGKGGPSSLAKSWEI